MLDQMAEGFGTLTVDAQGQDAVGRGVWQDGTWRVAIAHPLISALTETDVNLEPGGASVAAFAVWEGGAQEVGARKAWSAWVPVRLE